MGSAMLPLDLCLQLRFNCLQNVILQEEALFGVQKFELRFDI